MTNNILQICYIDDGIDPYLTRYLYDFSKELFYREDDSEGYEIVYEEVTFTKDDTYDSLIDNSKVNQSAIALVDSKLFRNRDVGISKFTGEQFIVILKKVLPYIKTIVITQNDIEFDSFVINKYNQLTEQEDSTSYYDFYLKPFLNKSLSQFIDETSILNDMKKKKEFDPILIDSIDRNLDGLEDTTSFKKENLDELINLFNEIKGRD